MIFKDVVTTSVIKDRSRYFSLFIFIFLILFQQYTVNNSFFSY